jgi:hypothetical protein
MAVVLFAVAAVVLTTSAGALAEPAPSASAPAPAPGAGAAAPDPNLGPANPGTTVCTVDHNLLDEITGMVATAQGIYVVEGGDTFDPGSVQIWTIDPASCEATSENHGFDPADPQDLALGADGALWIADTGDGVGDENLRGRVTMERVDLSGSGPAVPYRMLYPSSGKITASAVLLQKDNIPILIANASGKAILYRPEGPPPPSSETGLPTLVQVGEFTPAKTDTANPLGNFGNAIVTGAATSPDRTKVVIRTLSDAYEFTVGADGDVLKAITDGTPVITPLPNEENGQAISYSADGKTFLTFGSVADPVLRSYTPHVPPPAAANPPAPSGGGSDRLSFSDITTIAAIVGFAGFLSVVAGVIGVYRARSRYRERGEWDEYDEGGDYGRRGRGQGRDSRDRRGPGRGQRSGRRGEGGSPQYDDDGFERVPRARPRPGRSDVWGPANQGDYGSQGGYADADHGSQQAPSYGRGQPAPHGQHGPPPPVRPGPAPVPHQMPHPMPPSVPQQAPPPGSGQGPNVGRARPRPASGGQVYGRPRPDQDPGHDGPRRGGGYGHDNIDH